MKTNTIATIIERVKKSKKIAILDVTEIVDLKVESDMKEVLNAINTLNTKVDSYQNTMNAKYNVLIGMITFLGFVIAVVTTITQLNG